MSFIKYFLPLFHNVVLDHNFTKTIAKIRTYLYVVMG
jgi:hypothetical protein